MSGRDAVFEHLLNHGVDHTNYLDYTGHRKSVEAAIKRLEAIQNDYNCRDVIPVQRELNHLYNEIYEHCGCWPYGDWENVWPNVFLMRAITCEGPRRLEDFEEESMSI